MAASVKDTESPVVLVRAIVRIDVSLIFIDSLAARVRSNVRDTESEAESESDADRTRAIDRLATSETENESLILPTPSEAASLTVTASEAIRVMARVALLAESLVATVSVEVLARLATRLLYPIQPYEPS